MTVFGIKNCNTVKRALEWLGAHKVSYDFHDYKTKGITASKLKEWSRQVGWETLVNRKGTTWRQLDDRQKAQITNQGAAIKLMTEKPSVIKRPLIEKDGKVIALGFDESEYAKIFS
ncbi:MAG: ArsC family reductase [Bacteroidota bacterium]|jgi:arsenate reductase|nr:MAG: ArsC family reductase [Bacteroidota bacterium]